ncbi:MAG: hypothetical protein Tsb0013_11150 [Phycisphaerales bacterium]
MFPVHDWQFWVVTLMALAALLYLLRGLLPGAKKRKAARRGRTTLTVGGKSVGR